MASTIHPAPRASTASAPRGSRAPGLVLVGLGVLGAVTLHSWVSGVPIIVGSVLAGAMVGNLGLATPESTPGLSYSSKTILRTGIVLLGLRLSIGDVAGLGAGTLGVIVATVVITFFVVQVIGRKMGLSAGLSLLVASGFSICGNSAIASVKGVASVEEEEVAAAIGLVTLCGTAAIFVVPALGSAFGLTDSQLGVWTGASVQDTAQVIAVASTAGPAVLAVATAVKLTRVLFLAPIVAGVSIWHRTAESRGSDGVETRATTPPILPLFVVGFATMMVLRTVGLVPHVALEAGQTVERYALAAGMVGLGSSVRMTRLRLLGLKPLMLGAAAWGIVGAVAFAAIHVMQIS